MKAWTIAGAGLVLMSGVGIAMAQAPATPPAGAPPMEDGAGRGAMGEAGRGHWFRHHRMGEMMDHMPPSKAAHFRLRRQGAMLDIKCADDEPMKACVDAAGALLDKVAAQK